MIEDKSAFNRFTQAFMLLLKSEHNFSIKISKAREVLSQSVGASNHNQLLSQLPRPLEDWQESDALSKLSSLLKEKHGITLDCPCSELIQAVRDEFESMPDDLSKLSAKSDQAVYAITSSYSGYPDVTIAKGIDMALRTFLKAATMSADWFPDDSVSFIGQDNNDGLPLLAMLLDSEVIVTLQRPPISDGQSIRDGQLVNLSNTRLPGIDSAMPPQDIAYRLTRMYSSMSKKERGQREGRVEQSIAALRFSRDYGEVLTKSGQESKCHVKDQAFDTQALSQAIDGMKMMHSIPVSIRD